MCVKLADRRPAGRGDPQHAAYRQQYALRPARRAGRVDDEGRAIDVVGIKRRRPDASSPRSASAVPACSAPGPAKITDGADVGVPRRSSSTSSFLAAVVTTSAAIGIRQAVADLAFGRVIADRDDDGAGPERGKAGFDRVDAVRQVDREPVALLQAGLRQVRGDRRSALGELRVGDGAGRSPSKLPAPAASSHADRAASRSARSDQRAASPYSPRPYCIRH